MAFGPHELVDLMLIKNDWDTFRTLYIEGMLSFQDIQQINDLLYPRIKDQSFYSWKALNLCFSSIAKSTTDRLRVFELGCYCGALAKKALSRYPAIEIWYGADICNKSLDAQIVEHDIRFKTYYMTEWFHNMRLPSPVNLFVSTHTLEHMTDMQVMKSIENIATHQIKYVILELPLRENGKVWKGGASTHVSQLGRKHIVEAFKAYGYSLIHNINLKTNLWVAAWKSDC